MFEKNDSKVTYDAIRQQILDEMSGEDPASEKFSTMIENLKKLEDAGSTANQFKIKPETLIKSGATLIGILAILSFEHVYPVASKAFGFVSKP